MPTIPFAAIWLAGIILFAVLEAVTASALVSIWFAVGSLAALITSFITDIFWIQVVVFFVVSIAVLCLVRPLSKKYFTPKTQATNADRLVGEQAIVTEEIDNLAATGQVRLKGQIWTARSEGEEKIPSGARVTVVRIEGVKVIVKQAEA